jgi:hypothetical protein
VGERQCWDSQSYSSSLQGLYSNPTWVEMASNRAFPGSNVMALVRNESSTDALVAMLASCPPVNIQGN